MRELGCQVNLKRPLRFDPFDGWQLTDYARAILELYDLPFLPLHLNQNTGLTGVALELRTTQTQMYEHDALILGATCLMGNADAGDQGQQILLNITHDQSGITWNSANPLDKAPVTAYAAVPAQGLPIIPLPEAFFLPAHSRMVHSWRNAFAGFGAVTGGAIHWVGLLLPRPKFKERPKTICVEGQQIRIGSRVPWFSTIGLGTETVNSGVPSFAWIEGSRYVGYTQPFFRDVEIHSINANFFQLAGVSQDPVNLQFRIADFGAAPMWMPKQTNIVELAGDFTKAWPTLPLTEPYLLRAGHQLEIAYQNQRTTTIPIPQAMLSVIGVQLCN